MIKYFIKKTVVTLSLNIGIALLGFFMLPKMANEFIPAVEIPAVGVIYPTTVLGPRKISQELIEPFEKLVLRSGSVERVETVIQAGRTVSYLFFDWKYRPEDCLQIARQLANQVVRPSGILEPILILHRPTLSPIYRIAMTGQSLSQISSMASELAVQIERLPGVAEVRLDGAARSSGVIEIDPVKLASQKLSFSDVIKTATESWGFRHLSHSTPASYVRIGLDNFRDLQNLNLPSGEGSISLRWVASIHEQQDLPKVLFGKGEPSVILEVIKAPGTDAVSIVEGAKKIIDQSLLNNPIHQTIIYDEAQKIADAQSGVLGNFTSGLILNSIILIFFLGSISGCVIASSIFPTAILGALIVMKWLGISFNIFSLNGFSLAAGMITDSSTVVLESILRRKQKGEEIAEASASGTSDVSMGVFTGALTSSAVLLPICLQSGVSSKLFSDLAVTLISANFLCLIAVYTLVPWLSANLLAGKSKPPMAPVAVLFGYSSRFVTFVSGFALGCLKRSVHDRRFRVALLAGVSAFSFLSMMFIPPSELLPMVNSRSFAITIPVTRSQLDASGKEMQQKISESLGGLEDVDWALSTRNDDSINLTLTLKESGEIKNVVARVSEVMKRPVQQILSFPLGPTPPTEPMNYDGYFYLNSGLTLAQRKALIQSFCSQKGVIDCRDIDHYQEMGIQLRPLPLQMARAESEVFSIATEGYSQTRGIDLTSTANLPLSKPVFLSAKQPVSLLTEVPVITSQGSVVRPLRSLFEQSFESQSTAIFRVDQTEYTPLYFKVKGITVGDAIRSMNESRTRLKIADSQVKGMGGIQSMAETFSKMGLALTIAGILNFVILLLQFKSAIQAAIIMYSIPLAVGGSILGLNIMGETLNAGVIVGFVLLIGIVVNNGILLMESANQALEEGKSIDESLEIAVSSRTRPILMTACGTIFGMMPTLLFTSEGSELYRGMAIVNIFGMAFGSFLTLVVTPILTRLLLKPKETT